MCIVYVRRIFKKSRVPAPWFNPILHTSSVDEEVKLFASVQYEDCLNIRKFKRKCYTKYFSLITDNEDLDSVRKSSTILLMKQIKSL
jgi:hypothetical protein